MVDISQIEQLLTQTGLGLSSVFEILPDMVFVVDRDERILFVNQVAACAMAGKAEELVGRRQGDLFRPDLAARHSLAIQHVFHTGETVVAEDHQDLQVRSAWMDTRLVPFRDPSGNIAAVVGIVRDVSERRLAQETLALREAYLRSMLDNLPYLAWLKNAEGKFQVVNEPFAKAAGKANPSEVLGLDDFALWPHELAAHYVADDQEVMRTRQQKLVEEQISDHGVLRWVETFKSPVFDATGKVIGTTGLGHDITQRRQLQEEQRRSREQLRALAAHVESVREQERVRISREIHDELGQSLTCMGMDLAFLDRQIDPENKDRPPISQERLHLLPDGLVRIELRKPYRDGTYAVDMDPLSLLCRLATSIPPPKRHTVHYGGVLAPASKLRPKVVPPPVPVPAGQEASTTSRPPTHRSIYRPWCDLLKRTFAEDVEKCVKCGGRMKLKALVQKPDNIARFLKHLGEPTCPPPLAPARAPPYWQARELRHRPQAQTELFDA